MYSRTIRAAAAAATLALALMAPGADAARKKSKPLTRAQVQKMIDAAVKKAVTAGPAGAQGPAGAVGAAGSAGATGPTGPKGEKGDKGDTGAPGTNTLTGPAGGVLTGDYPNPGLAWGVVGSQHIAEGAVQAAQLAQNSVAKAHLQDAAVGAAELADNSVTAAKIVNGSIDIHEIEGPPAYTAVPYMTSGWRSALTDLTPNVFFKPQITPAGSYRDHLGRIWFTGTVERFSGDFSTMLCVDTLAPGDQHKGIFSVPTGNNLEIPGAVHAYVTGGKLCLKLIAGSTDQVFLDGISIRE